MTTRTVKIQVSLPNVHQEIWIGSSLGDKIGEAIESLNHNKFIAVVDETVFSEQCDRVSSLLAGFGISSVLQLDVSSCPKDFSVCERLVDFFIKNELNRNGCAVGIGGGYIGDVVGFTASIYMRGIDFLYVPTTFMGMADSVIGKVAVNFSGKKNLLGSFYGPRMTFCDVRLVDSVGTRSWVYGLVEVWKHFLLTADDDGQQKIIGCLSNPEEARKAETLNLIFESMNIKRSFVENDCDDRKGIHKALSLGHTFANYLESVSGMPHGPAVLYGIVLGHLISKKIGLVLDDKRSILFVQAVRSFEREIGMWNKMQEILNVNEALVVLRFDKINTGSGYSFVLIDSMGYRVDSNVSVGVLEECLNKMKQFEFIDIY